jgi:hypothetical protein
LFTGTGTHSDLFWIGSNDNKYVTLKTDMPMDR